MKKLKKGTVKRYFEIERVRKGGEMIWQHTNEVD